MAQRLYREWFVHFRFPGHERVRLVDSPLGKIPEGWEVAKLPNVVFFQEGPGLRKWQWTEHRMKVINVKNILKDGDLNVNNTNRYISLGEFLKSYSHFAIEEGDIVIASSGNTYGKIGRLFAHHLPLMMNTSVIRFHSLDRTVLDNDYLYWFLRSDNFRQQIESFVIGSAQPNFGPTHLKQMHVIVPDSQTQRTAGNCFVAINGMTDNCRIRNDILRRTRDLLLPKLISGELDVSEVDIADDKKNGASCSCS